MALSDDFNAKYAEAMQLVKSYIDCQDSKKQAQIDEIKEQLEAIKNSEGDSGNLTLLNKLNDIINFLKTDIVNITKNIFATDCDNNNSDGGNGGDSGNSGNSGDSGANSGDNNPNNEDFPTA